MRFYQHQESIVRDIATSRHTYDVALRLVYFLWQSGMMRISVATVLAMLGISVSLLDSKNEGVKENPKELQKGLKKDVKRSSKTARIIKKIILWLVALQLLNVAAGVALASVGIDLEDMIYGDDDTRMFKDPHGAGDFVGDRGTGIKA